MKKKTMHSTDGLVLRPSNAHRWLSCPASETFINAHTVRGILPPDAPSAVADEGTRAHALAAELLLHGASKRAKPDDAAMQKHCENYAAHVAALMDTMRRPRLYVEQKVPLVYQPEHTGTTDCLLVEKDGSELNIVDLKYGAGVSVQAVRNVQLMIYALGAIQHTSRIVSWKRDARISLTIFQPRVRNERTVRSWTITLDALREQTKPVLDTAARVLAGTMTGEFHPGESQCRFCPAQSICSARAMDILGEFPEDVTTAVQTGDEETTARDPQALSAQELSRALAAAPALRSWLTKLEAFALAALESKSMRIPGFKLVHKRALTRWKNDVAAALYLQECSLRETEIYRKTLCTPNQAAELLASAGHAPQRVAKMIAKLTTTPEGSITLAPEDDRRAAAEQISAADEFDILPPNAVNKKQKPSKKK